MYIYVDWIQVTFDLQNYFDETKPATCSTSNGQMFDDASPQRDFCLKLRGDVLPNTHTHIVFKADVTCLNHLNPYPWRIPRHKLVGSGSSQVISWCLVFHRWFSRHLNKHVKTNHVLRSYFFLETVASGQLKITRAGWVCPRPLGDHRSNDVIFFWRCLRLYLSNATPQNGPNIRCRCFRRYFCCICGALFCFSTRKKLAKMVDPWRKECQMNHHLWKLPLEVL